MDLKMKLCSLLGVIGGFIGQLFNGWDSALNTLIACMLIDYITGIIVAAVFKNSPKTDGGSLKSVVGFKGLCKKGVTLLIVLLSVRLDLVLSTTFIKDAVVICYTCNEIISIVENAGLMGVPIPKVIREAIEILKSKTEKEESK